MLIISGHIRKINNQMITKFLLFENNGITKIDMQEVFREYSTKTRKLNAYMKSLLVGKWVSYHCFNELCDNSIHAGLCVDTSWKNVSRLFDWERIDEESLKAIIELDSDFDNDALNLNPRFFTYFDPEEHPIDFEHPIEIDNIKMATHRFDL